LNKDSKADSQYGSIEVQEIPDGKTEPKNKKKFNLRHNSLIILKSRKISYEIKANTQKVFVVGMKIGGPRCEFD
jgi:hypothetical protein